ncbi:MAG: hypothetical protein IPN64_00135 [Propionivibrio sp.]|uniref:hypothetical protein n=1 Tax=Propionivibrio sp. TaxID=2212460 RepID=UPI0025E93177|nr:hypothetical protein [Propionivibrio sp.]MBK8892507.1 hypothetical protein [Propionivibrio sp.]
MIMIDACKSGAATVGFRGLEERRSLAQLSRSFGTHMIAATTKDQPASGSIRWDTAYSPIPCWRA